MQASRDTRLPG